MMNSFIIDDVKDQQYFEVEHKAQSVSVGNSLACAPTDILLIIFNLCGPKTWPVLSQVCQRFYTILGPDSFLWEKTSQRLIIVNEISPTFRTRIYSRLVARDKCRVYKNWIKGNCVLKPVTSILERHVLPWLVLESDKLWVGVGRNIKSYSRTPPSAFHGQGLNQKYQSQRKELLDLFINGGDVGHFVVKDGVLVAGDTNGSLLVWRASNWKLQFKKTKCHSSEISAVGLYKNVMVSGSRDKTVKIWRHSWRSLSAVHSINLEDRVLSLDIDPSGRVLCTGTAGHCNVAPSQVYDLATGTLIGPLRNHVRDGEGVYDIHFESPNEVLTADFNSALRLWDLRIRSNVSVWEDPHDSAINCIASDNNFTILTGTATHGGIRSWDKRQRKCNHLYFVRPDLRSPVYCLDFDSSELFAALDSSVLGFDFSVQNRKPTDGLVVYSCS